MNSFPPSNGSAEECSPARHFARNPDLWYNDGSIVLVAETFGFRVHTSILAATCVAFRDMAVIGQSKCEETFEGCPVVRLQDSAADVGHFLKSIYGISRLCAHTKTTFPVVAGILRLSTKYQAHHLRQMCIKILHTAFPSTLEAWDHRHTRTLIPPFEGELGAVIALAMENDVEIILPGAFYTASRSTVTEVTNVFQKTAFKASVLEEVYVRWITGRDAFLRAEVQYILAFMKPDFVRPHCRDWNRDRDRIQARAAQALRETDRDITYQRLCSDNPHQVGLDPDICGNCRNTVASDIIAARQTIWDNLPGFFGLSDWETLRARDLQDEGNVDNGEAAA